MDILANLGKFAHSTVQFATLTLDVSVSFILPSGSDTWVTIEKNIVLDNLDLIVRSGLKINKET